jgi:hypothetical protein
MDKTRRNILVVLGVLIVIVVVAAVFGIRALIQSGITAGPDNMFGDQHLKTAVALIELHKVRYGSYPEDLSDLRFVGDWDQIAIQSVSYTPSADRKGYHVEVVRGWVGRPNLKMPDEFWQGTGFRRDLKPPS